jgi:D-amino peptidase
MMVGVDESFDPALYTGYHSKAGVEDNPLAHTSTLRISRLFLNGEIASEFTLYALCAARYGVRSVFLSGDEGICADARALVPAIATVENPQRRRRGHHLPCACGGARRDTRGRGKGVARRGAATPNA